MQHRQQTSGMPVLRNKKGKEMNSLAEYEAICLGKAQGEITPADVVQAISRASALGDAYYGRLLAKAAEWKPKPRPRRQPRMEVKQGGMDKSQPRGDL